jgi:hypothetical protein
MKDIVFQTAVRFGTKEEWHKLFEIATKTKSDIEKLRLLRALTHTQDHNLIQSYNQNLLYH